MNKKYLQEFIYFNQEIIKNSIIVGFSFATIVFCLLPLQYMRSNWELLYSLSQIPIVLVLAIITLISKKNHVRKYNLFSGCCSVSLSISSIVLAYKLLISSGSSNILLLLILLLFLLSVNIICLFITRMMIKKGMYKQSKSKLNSVYACAAIGSSLGLVWSRNFFKNVSLEIETQVLVLLSLFIAVVMSFGNMNLLKFYYQIKYKL